MAKPGILNKSANLEELHERTKNLQNHIQTTVLMPTKVR
jgi:hypothetical protein